MAITSVGYDGSIDETQWAEMIKKVGSSDYGVIDAPSWKVTAVVGGTRTVSIATGKGWGHGVFDHIDANVTVALDSVSSGFRWDLIAMRRDWTGTGGSSTIVKVNGTATKGIPTGRESGPGVIDDQPLALVQITAGQSMPTAIVDLRCFSGNGGMAANDVLALNYLKAIAADCMVAGVTYRCFSDSLGNLYWVDEHKRGNPVTLPMGTGWTATVPARAWTTSGGDFVHVAADMTYTGTATPVEKWILATLPAGMRPQSNHYLTGYGNNGADTQVFNVNPDGTIRIGQKPLGKHFVFNGIFPL
jgi:hypothetical protein